MRKSEESQKGQTVTKRSECGEQGGELMLLGLAQAADDRDGETSPHC